MRKRTIQEVADFFGFTDGMDWPEIHVRIGEYHDRQHKRIYENPNTHYVVKFEPERRQQMIKVGDW